MAVVLVVAGIAGCTVFNMLDTRKAAEDYQSQTSQAVEQTGRGDGAIVEKGGATTQTTTDDANGSAPQDGTGNRYGAPAQSGTGLVAEVQSQSVDELAAYAGTSASDTGRVEELFRSLPVSEYLTGVETTAAGAVAVTYEYQDRDRVARDDDHVDLALVYNAVVAMCAVDDLQTLTLYEVEPDDGRLERDTQAFERSMLENLLGTALDGGKLTADSWEELRSQVMTEHIYDEAWDRADRE